MTHIKCSLHSYLQTKIPNFLCISVFTVISACRRTSNRKQRMCLKWPYIYMFCNAIDVACSFAYQTIKRHSMVSVVHNRFQIIYVFTHERKSSLRCTNMLSICDYLFMLNFNGIGLYIFVLLYTNDL